MTHSHLFVIRDDFTRPDSGVRQIEARCVCGLSERRQYDGTEVVSVRYRYANAGGGWVDAAELLKISYPVMLCPACEGTDAYCETCGGLLVVEPDGTRPGPPPKVKRRRR
jgi:hypothetical protein